MFLQNFKQLRLIATVQDPNCRTDPIVYSSPNYPNNYPNSIDRELLINIPSSTNLVINILDFELESSSTEIFGHRLIYDPKNRWGTP